MVKVLDKDECAVPFSEKSELWAGDDTLSIPSWLNDMAERSGINFSGVLQEALKAKLNIE